MSDTDIDYLPISALQHFAYCPRQFALIHIEQVWSENRFTAEGRLLHERVDSGEAETRGDLHIARSMRLLSKSLKLTGMADVVEFHRNDHGVVLTGLNGKWLPYPVEYKRGRSKQQDWDRLQLCAQALCLEEMLGVAIPEGALFYGKPRRRETVPFDQTLRNATCDLAERMHAVWSSRSTPPAEPGPKCDNCSLYEQCLPNTPSAKSYLHQMLDE